MSWSSAEKRPESTETPGICRKEVPSWQGLPPPSKGPPPGAENSLPAVLPTYLTAQSSLSTLIEPADRVIVIGESGHLDPVNHWRCSLTQQLSGPLTDTKRCAPLHFVIEDEAVVVEDATGEGAVGEAAVGEAAVGEEEAPHAVANTANRSVEILAYVTVTPLL